MATIACIVFIWPSNWDKVEDMLGKQFFQSGLKTDAPVPEDLSDMSNWSEYLRQQGKRLGKPIRLTEEQHRGQFNMPLSVLLAASP